MLVVGYLNASSSYEPSLALYRINPESSVPLELVRDLQDPVCFCEEMDAPHHRYLTQFIPQW